MPDQPSDGDLTQPDNDESRLTPLRALMEKLETLRTSRGMSFEELGKKVGYDRSDLRKLERGIKFLSPYIVGRLDAFYGTGDQLSVLHRLAKAEPVRNKYKAYVNLERSALSLHQYATAPMPGLLQTEAYARALLRTAPSWGERQSEETVAERLGRQERLTGESPAHYRAILDEFCLTRRLGSPEEWRDQVAHLVDMARLPNVTLQVLPFASGMHDLTGGNLTLVSQPDGESAAYQESSHTASLITEPKSVAELRLSYDALRDAALPPGESVAYLQRAMEASTTCTPPDRT
ncbi:helix-turn-helix domain-containing protein [Streptomyces iconiensis]|uniref:Helix-turn-helix transcriptional regulator n=1 Tax=Streptomyces iconiensis TaxID=1384038 RepID=A0ABT7A132_9ACTN|nr:helix-turn-helix transcriptional regulator [Streptomyces iconiensis]MDJ1135025.1 helix-turn-helix transcriptional regulator [Streptomyces iconiensis]